MAESGLLHKLQRAYATHRMRRKYRRWNEEDARRLEFYGQFIKPGDLVFDVGANIGNRTKIFLKLGARVVAVEPQALCADFLQSELGKDANFKLVRMALGASKGEAEMLVSNAHTISSLSEEWINATRESGRFRQYEWNKRQSVEVSTLDSLIREYGNPVFVKVDVEGFEYEVISGFSGKVDYFSIEFTPELIDKTYKCISHITSLYDAEFQLSLGESMEFYLDSWVDESEIREILSRFGYSDFGDVYVHRL